MIWQPLGRAYKSAAGVYTLYMQPALLHGLCNLVKRHRNAFQHGAGKVWLAVARRYTEEYATGFAVPYRCALAQQVGQEEETFGAGRYILYRVSRLS